jgi:hypothetical protein
MKKNIKYLLVIPILLLAIVVPDFAEAAPLTRTSIRLGRLGINASTGSDLLVTFRLATSATTVSKIQITFPAGFVVTTGTPTVGTTGFPTTPASITVPPGTLTAAATNASRTIVVSGLTSASLTTTPLYGFTIPTGTVTNPATAGQYNVAIESQTSGSVQIDSSTVPVSIYGASSNLDQVVVSASVAPNFSFSLSGNTDTVPKVDVSTIQTSTGVNMVVSTNSPLGYTAYVKSGTGSLTSATSPGTPISTGTFGGGVDTVTAGTSFYGFVPSTGAACSTCTGSITYDTEYSVASGTQAGAFNSTNFASFVSRNGYTNADTILLRERAAVGSTIGYANDYTDTLTIVAAGNF